MRNPIITALAFLLLGLSTEAFSQPLPYVTAHRGGHISGLIPENSIAGVGSAKRFGYGAVECDPKLTSDGVYVVMHDKTINRTMRLKDGYRRIEGDVYVSETDFAQLRQKYVLASDDPSQRVQIPTLEELALECRRLGMRLMLHSGDKDACRLVRSILGEDWICFSSNLATIRTMRAEGFTGLCLYSTTERDVSKIISELRGISGPLGISSMDKNKKDPALRQYTPGFIKSLSDAGFEVQSSIFRAPWEVRSLKDGVTMMLTDYFWLQQDGRREADSWKASAGMVKAGQTVRKTFDTLPGYGAILLETTFEGDAEITAGGFRYSFSHRKMEKETIGIRLFGKAPEVEIKATGDIRLGKTRARVYEMP